MTFLRLTDSERARFLASRAPEQLAFFSAPAPEEPERAPSLVRTLTTIAARRPELGAVVSHCLWLLGHTARNTGDATI